MPAKGWAKLTPEQIAEGIESYFADCDKAIRGVMVGKRVAEVSRPYTIIGLCNHLGITKETFYKWLEGTHPRDKERTCDTCNGKECSAECKASPDKPQWVARTRRKAAETGKQEQAYISVSDLLARARGRVEASTLERALTGELDGKVAGMVLGNMGYSTKQEIAHTGGIAVQITGLSNDQVSRISK